MQEVIAKLVVVMELAKGHRQPPGQQYSLRGLALGYQALIAACEHLQRADQALRDAQFHFSSKED